ncbi:MAG: flagellar hook-length control protein FliK [Candidatus Margulisbacteria bacterium]|nr:flagellar hook-length control protein FliK [Candidatus Margulisiibacteriota bacterium]
MTIQFLQLEQAEPRLLTDSTNLRDRDSSFEEKLRQEQARLGLLFSPFAQLSGLFAEPLGLDLTVDYRSPAVRNAAEQTAPAPDRSGSTDPVDPPTLALAGQKVRLFDSLPLSDLSRRTLQELLVNTQWLVPNIQAQPSLFNAALNGELRPSFDLQALIDQLVRQATLVREKGKVQFALTLEPAELGQVVITLTAQAGLVSVDLQAESSTRKLFDARRAELEKALAKANVHFDRLTIREVKDHA